MRIALVFNRFRSDGGTERITLNAFQALASDDVEWLVMARNWGGPRQGNVRYVQCNPFALGRSWRLLAFARAVRKRLQTMSADIVQSQVHLPEAEIYRADGGAHAEWLCQRRRRGGRLKRWWRAMEPYHRLKVRMERRMYASPRLRAVICNSEMVKADIQRQYPDCRADLHVIDYGIDATHFALNTERVGEGRYVREYLGIAEAAPVFAYVGSGFERKGLATAIRALATMSDSSAHLIIVGRDSRAWQYRYLAWRLGVSRQTHFMGAQSDIRPYLWAANALVHPALYEPFGLVVLEAMAAGLPAITSDRTGAGLALVTSPETGRILDALDTRGFARAMMELAKHAPGQRSVGNSACESAAAGYSLERMRTNLLNFYASLPGGPGS